MMFFETPVYTPRGWIEARQLKSGDTVFSWNGRKWVPNEIARVTRGQARRAFSMFCVDGTVPRVFRCTPDHGIATGRRHTVAAKDLTAGHIVFMSEGQHVFKAELGMVEMADSDEPQETIGLEFAKPSNYLAQGYLCRA